MSTAILASVSMSEYKSVPMTSYSNDLDPHKMLNPNWEIIN